MDRLRHQADFHSEYEAYFTYLMGKFLGYKIPAEHTYNMDEKDLAMGMTGKSNRSSLGSSSSPLTTTTTTTTTTTCTAAPQCHM
jgi:hypothetical protein